MTSPTSQEYRGFSIPTKYSTCSEGRGSFGGGVVKTPLQNTINTQKTRASRTSLGGQVQILLESKFLYFEMDKLKNLIVTDENHDIQWRRLLFAAGAALCALLFAMLAVQTIRKAKQPLLVPTVPNLAVRRSTIMRTSRKSMYESGINREESSHGKLQTESKTSDRTTFTPIE
ncbi:unnamed protein product [Thelazia callipaeda]|uniref:Uncharacterized protein n=1 Tax=Thelazia callipaeda TaxID=103827 RepID=A0A0N5CW37_THECL|nr:unnamed protein product [Thelazia callipaeda]